MLFTEAYLGTGNAFIVRRSDEMKGVADLKGKILAVNRGTISDTWATEQAPKVGFDVQRYENFPDSVQAVITRRAFAALNEIPTANYAASQNQQIKVASPSTRAQLRLRAAARERRVPEQGGRGDRVHEARRLAREELREVVQAPAPKDPALTTIFPAGARRLQGPRPRAAHPEVQLTRPRRARWPTPLPARDRWPAQVVRPISRS